MVAIASQNSAYYVRQAHFDEDRMAGSVAQWKNNNGSQQSSPIDALSISSGSSKSPNAVAPSTSFSEVLDIINPLQHLPFIGDIYRNFTGDKLSPVAKIIGNTIYGGGIGALASIASAAIEEHTGKNMMSSLIDNAKLETPKYIFEEQDRTAGAKTKSAVEQAHSDTPEQPKRVELATILPQQSSIQTSQSNNDIINRIEIEKREPVTRVSIDVAVAKVRNDWSNLNS